MQKKKYCRTCALMAAASVMATALAAGLLVTCSNGDRRGAEDSTREAEETVAGRDHRFRITATTGMVADIVRQVAGDRGEVTPIIGEGSIPISTCRRAATSRR